MTESDILYQNNDCWVKSAGAKGYEVYRAGATHATRIASIGHGAAHGLTRAIAICDERATK